MTEKLEKVAAAVVCIIALALLLYWNVSTATSIRGDHGYVSDECWYVPAARNLFYKLFHVNITGYPYPNKTGIHEYLNLEHPPLGKYIIAAAIILFGDKPLSWRIPSIVEGLALPVVALLCVLPCGTVAAVAALVVTASDPLLHAMSCVAMLDIHAAFFTALAVLAACTEHPLLSAVFLGLSGSVKAYGFFALPALAYSCRESGCSRLRSLVYTFLVPAIVYLAVNAPLIIVFGPQKWITEQLNALKWHTSNKGGHPAASPPWAWFINEKPFPLNYGPDLYASTNPFVLLAAIPCTLIAFTCSGECLRRARILFAWFWSFIAGYVILYFAGGTTQFSFYLTPAAMMVDAAVAAVLVRIGENPELLKESWSRIKALASRLAVF